MQDKPTQVEIKRLDYLDALRGFSMISVVLMHTWNRAPMYIQHNTYFSGLESFIQMFFLTLFFFISGFLGCRKLSFNSIKIKFVTWIIGASVFSLIYILFIDGASPDIIRHSTQYRCYWFTIALFQLMVIAQIVFRLPRFNTQILISLSILSVVVLFMFFRTSADDIFYADILALREVMFYLPFYAFGIICGRFKEQFFEAIDNNLITNIIVIGFFGIFMCRFFIDGALGQVLSYICRFPATITIFLLFYKHRHLFSMPYLTSKFLTTIGKRSLEVYFIHYFVLPSTLPFVFLFETNNPILMMIIVGVTLSCIISVISCLFGSILKLSPYLSFLFFGQNRQKPVH